MDVADLLDMALAAAPRERVEVATLEPANVPIEAVGGLAQLLSELVDNAVAFSEPEQPVRVSGFFNRDDYLITVSDHGVGIPESLIVALNRVLEDPSATENDLTASMGIQLVARLAARLGVAVRLVPAMPGTTARVTLPARLVGSGQGTPEAAGESPSPEALERPRAEVETPPSTSRRRRFNPFRHQVAMSEAARIEAEAFLDRVFGSLTGKPRSADRPARRPGMGNDTGPTQQPPRSEEGVATTTRLRVRVPGANFTIVEDEPSTLAAERAIDIRSALTLYQQGKRTAAEQGSSRRGTDRVPDAY